MDTSGFALGSNSINTFYEIYNYNMIISKVNIGHTMKRRRICDLCHCKNHGIARSTQVV